MGWFSREGEDVEAGRALRSLGLVGPQLATLVRPSASVLRSLSSELLLIVADECGIPISQLRAMAVGADPTLSRIGAKVLRKLGREYSTAQTDWSSLDAIIDRKRPEVEIDPPAREVAGQYQAENDRWGK
jgi:hypothetical protein